LSAAQSTAAPTRPQTAALAAPPADSKQQQQQQQQPSSHEAAEAEKTRRHQHNTKPPPLCSGASCQRMSDLLPQLQFRTPGQQVPCSCQQFSSGACFAPGCFPCNKSCFSAVPELAKAPGPFGTGLLCSSGCQPCCSKAGDPSRPANATCTLFGDTC
jgi:hypothetical protein